MKKIRIKCTWSEIGDKFKAAFAALGGIGLVLWGVFILLYALLLTIANLTIRAYELLKRLAIWVYAWLVTIIRSFPCVSVVAVFLIMVFVAITAYMNMKVKLTTTEYQRDSLETKLDSIKVLNGDKTTYYRYYRTYSKIK